MKKTPTSSSGAETLAKTLVYPNSPSTVEHSAEHIIRSVSVEIVPQSDREAVQIFYVPFGEWARPRVDHPRSRPIHELVQSMREAGKGALIDQGRISLASKFDGEIDSFRMLRMKSGLSQTQLAERMETSQSSIARIEAGTQEPTLRTLRKLAQILNTDLNILGQILK